MKTFPKVSLKLKHDRRGNRIFPWQEMAQKPGEQNLSTIRAGHSPVAQTVENLPAMQETRVRPLGREDPPGKGMAIHSSILAWRIPWREDPGRLQSAGSQRVGHSD